MTVKLEYLKVAGFKSIDNQMQKIEFATDVTLLVGPNGAGKSNVVSFFQMLTYMMAGAFRQFVAEQGYARSLLHYGPEVTTRLSAELHFCECDEKSSMTRQNIYRFSLAHAANDTLIFADETVEARSGHKQSQNSDSVAYALGVGHQESQLKAAHDRGEPVATLLYNLLQLCQVYQFHNTASPAKIRGQGYINDNRILRSDGGNLAAFLFAMKANQDTYRYYERIVRYIQQIMPQFGDFDLAPAAGNHNYIRLDWHEQKRPDYLFGPHQLSDGSLRFMALAALLLQPPALLPTTIIIDEPELGLHPAALTVFAAMVKIASQHSQVILATQSPRLVDEFNAEQIVVVERDEVTHASSFRRLDPVALQDWLDAYSLSELWEKNVFGGLP